MGPEHTCMSDMGDKGHKTRVTLADCSIRVTLLKRTALGDDPISPFILKMAFISLAKVFLIVIQPYCLCIHTRLAFCVTHET